MGLTYFQTLSDGNRPTGSRFFQFHPAGEFLFCSVGPGASGSPRGSKISQLPRGNRFNVFPCLGDYAGCLHLMEEIAAKPSFLPEEHGWWHV